MDLPENAEIEDFERWTVSSLKDYLARHGISCTAKKSELVALAYSCNVMKRPEAEVYTHDIQQSFHDYQDILKLCDNITIPDPLKITEGWIGEENEGMKYWPPVTIVDILDFYFFWQWQSSLDCMDIFVNALLFQ